MGVYIQALLFLSSVSKDKLHNLSDLSLAIYEMGIVVLPQMLLVPKQYR